MSGKMVKTEKGYFYKKICLYCGTEFLGNINNKFCSAPCSAKYRYKNKSYSLVCKKCKKQFKGNNPRQFYCENCSIKLKTRICKKCGKYFEVEHAKVKRDFCSKECSRVYDFNENIFENIKTFEQAYWIGFLMGDGHVRYDERRGIRELILGLSEKDYKHIYKFANFLGFKDKIPIKYDKNRKAYFFRVASKKLINDLKNIGFPIKDKTRHAKIIRFQDEKLNTGFILGLFDADGSAFISKNLFYISLCGTYEICKEFCNFLDIDERYLKQLKKTRSFELYEVKIGKQKKEIVHLFYKKLYSEAPVFLNRKKLVFEKFLNK